MSKKLNIKRLEMVFEESQIPSNDPHGMESPTRKNDLLKNSKTIATSMRPAQPLVQPEMIKNEIEPICPYIGILIDPQTAIAYPAEGNYCHRVLPAIPPNYEHQKAYCLSKSFVKCPFFTQKSGRSMPKYIRLKK